jgi:hypothetical protein
LGDIPGGDEIEKLKPLSAEFGSQSLTLCQIRLRARPGRFAAVASIDRATPVRRQERETSTEASGDSQGVDSRRLRLGSRSELPCSPIHRRRTGGANNRQGSLNCLRRDASSDLTNVACGAASSNVVTILSHSRTRLVVWHALSLVHSAFSIFNSSR